VLTLLPIWKVNPSANFSSAVDYPEVFTFIERIQTENRWTFAFDKTGEIQECLSIQLSVMLRELLGRHRAGTLDPIASYANESPEARRLARERPLYWEFLLTAELLKPKLTEVRRQFERQKMGLAHLPLRGISLTEFVDWIVIKMDDLVSLANALEGQLGVIQASWGPLGQPGDVQKIQQGVNEFVHLCDHLVEWEKDLHATTPPEEAQRVKNTMKGWTEVVLREMERLPDELLRPFEGGAKPQDGIKIQLTINPPSFDNFYAELDALRRAYSFPIQQ
jgi:hypothetical protein